MNITLETVACDLCHSMNTHDYLCVRDRIYNLPGEFQLVKCDHCGLLYINPRPDRASIGAFYPDLDYHAFRPDGGIKAQVKKILRNSEAKSLLDGLPQGARVLEIGCGTGELLVALRERGAQVMGIEPNAAAVATGQKTYGLHIEHGMLDDIPLEPGQFDLVLMKYALEHVHSPRETLTAIQKLLKTDGRAVFWVPNSESADARLFGVWWRGLDAPRHLYIFTPLTMRELIESAGMQLSRITYSPVPNDWAGSFEFWLCDHGLPVGIGRWFGVESPLAMLAWSPVSVIAAMLNATGRMRVTAIKKSG